MKKLLYILIILPLFTFQLQSQDNKHEKWHYFIDKNGKEVIKVSAKYVGNFSDGVAVIKKYYWDGGSKAYWNEGCIDTQGKMIIPAHYEDIKSFDDGVTFAKKRGNDYYQLIDKTGKIISEKKFEKAPYIISGMIKFTENGKIGYMNTKGEIIVPANKYVTSSGFGDDYACVAIEKDPNTWLYGFIDKSGKEIVPCQYKQTGTSSFNDGLARMKFPNGKTGYINTKGETVIEPKYSTTGSYGEGFYPASFGRTFNNWGLVDSNNQVVIEGIYDDLDTPFKNTVKVDLKGKHGYLKTDGSVLIPVEYDDFSLTFEKHGIAVMKKGETSYVFDINGEIITQSDKYEYFNTAPEYEYIMFREKESKKWGIMNFNGDIIIPASKFCSIGSFDSGLSKVKYCE